MKKKGKKISHKKIDHDICHDEKIKKMATKNEKNRRKHGTTIPKKKHRQQKCESSFERWCLRIRVVGIDRKR